jgi:hypothetical protein
MVEIEHHVAAGDARGIIVSQILVEMESCPGTYKLLIDY